ncbi:unnamed protein product [Rhizoctonia solani]|uniref:Amidase domain-containing protein n=1 Tax=Rhizoctonia solani TaxID=456999 RepID=A0A8H3BDK3_9AGAM|nr:unnamed protein product [Rhizoctonia solani]
MFDQALARARELDDHIAKTGKAVGPLHGVPVSIKDHLFVKGEDTACGYVAWAGKRVAEEDAVIVHILRAAGAIIYVKTTNPQALYGSPYFLFLIESVINSLAASDTFSNIYGRTTNPHNRKLAAGGSTGGEGALVGSRASLLGVGTDSGGSIRTHIFKFNTRIPSAWCGLYGLKPSSHRLPALGLTMPYNGKEDILIVTGPMAHSVRDLQLFCQVISEYEPWNLDPNTLSMPWNLSLAYRESNDRLVIGMMSDDGIVSPHPPIVRRLQEVREALVAAGHEVIDWVPISQAEMTQLSSKFYLPDGGEDIRAPLKESGEPAVPLIERLLALGESIGSSTLAESWSNNIQRDRMRSRVLRHWNETALLSKCGRPIDALLCPATATLAPPHDTERWGGYGTYWNLLDLPAAVFPAGKSFDGSRWKSSEGLATAKPRNPIEELVASQWSPDKYDGAPIGLQLVGRRWQEEKLLADLKVVDAVVNACI